MSDVFSRIGAAKLRQVVEHFYRQVVVDPMIGFLFDGKDVQRLIELEVQFTARMLGARTAYTGRSMRAAHAEARIFGGHFARRQELLRQSLVALDVDGEVTTAWLAHNEALRSQITPDQGSECAETRALAQDSGAPPVLTKLGRR